MKSRHRGKNIHKKEWLLRYSELMNEVERETEKAGYWQEKAYSLSTPNMDNLGIRSAKKLDSSDYVVKFIELAEHCSELADEAERQKKEILEAINSLSNHNYRQILSLYYIDGKNFREIAETLHYSLNWVWIQHTRALQELDI